MKFIRTYKILLIVFILSLITVGNAIACYKPSPEPSIVIEPTVEVSVEPSIVPTLETPTASPEAAVAPQGTGQGDGKSDGRSDGRSDGLCSKPPCVSGNVVLPLAPPAAGRAI